MSNYALAKVLRSGKQEPVKLVINKFRLKEDLVSFVSHKLEADSLTLITALDDSIYLRRFNLRKDEVMALFIPNTYEFLWNTSPELFMGRMKREDDHFWNEERIQLAKDEKISPVQVIILASIVDEETNYNPEKARIAGVYLNRLRTGMNLQADPTVKYSLKNFLLKRIYKIDLAFDSPYNTYRYPGLPPGPIASPGKSSIEAVVHPAAVDYLYFVSKNDGSHAFASSLDEHNRNVQKWQVEYFREQRAQGRGQK